MNLESLTLTMVQNMRSSLLSNLFAIVAIKRVKKGIMRQKKEIG